MLYEVITPSSEYPICIVKVILNPNSPSYERFASIVLFSPVALVITSYSIHYTKLYDGYPFLSENAIPSISNISAPSAINSGTSLTLIAPTVLANNSAITAQGFEISADGSSAWATYTTGTIDASYNNYYLRYYATNGVITSYSIHYTKLYDCSFKRACYVKALYWHRL